MPDPLTRKALEGSWRLLSWWHEAGGERVRIMSDNVHGALAYLPNGDMFVHIADAGRRPFLSGDPFIATPEEGQAAITTMLAYCGAWQIDGGDILHKIAMSSFPNWSGDTQRRHARLEGNRLTLSTSPFSIGGGTRTAHVEWKRSSDPSSHHRCAHL